MINGYRQAFIDNYSDDKYRSILHAIGHEFPGEPKFRVSETPVFIPKLLKERLLLATSQILKVINRPDFKELTKDALYHDDLIVPAESYQSRFIQLDFGICLDEHGDPIPKLIEMQGFPSLYFFQDWLGSLYQKHYQIPEELSVSLNGLSREEYIDLLRHEIVGDTDPKQVVLLEVEPEKQPTRIDFLIAEKMLGIKELCITKVIKRGRELFYKDDNGSEIKILKIYNRVIYDEISKRPDLKREFYFRDEVDVEWVGHPNWFFRISKYALPLFTGPFVPRSFYLHKLPEMPKDLENFVLKPLYSFAGSGVLLHITEKELQAIPDKENYILQEKVHYAPVVRTLDVNAKCEIRIMTIFNTRSNDTQILGNLMRLTKGEMVGVKYNKDKNWVGGSIGFFEA